MQIIPKFRSAVAGLWDTLHRKRARGISVEPLSPFNTSVRISIGFDLARLMLERSVIGHPETVYAPLRLDILQHVFSGHEPSGPNVSQAGWSRAAPELCIAYMLDASDDLLALDALGAMLAFLQECADILISRYGDGWYVGDQLVGTRPESQFAHTIRGTIQIINQRLVEHNVGYMFAGNGLIRSSEPELFKGVMEPCLVVLQAHERYKDVAKDFRKALKSWKQKDYKQAVHHSAESLEGMLRVVTKELMPDKHDAGAQIPANAQKLNGKKLWHPTYGKLLTAIYALRGDMGAHSEATKPEGARATDRDAEAVVYLSATMLVFVARSYEQHVQANQ